MLALLSEPSRHPLPLLRRRADDSPTHDGVKVLDQDATVDLGHQQVVRRPLHLLVLLKVVFDQFHDLLQRLWVTQPLPLYQAVKQGLEGGAGRGESVCLWGI